MKPAFPVIESWVPRPVADAALRLRAVIETEESSEIRITVLSQLISDPRMRVVWQELYKTKRNDNYESTGQFLHAATVFPQSWARKHRQQAQALHEAGDEHGCALLKAEAAIEESMQDILIDPKWSEQDWGVRLFFEMAYRSAIDIKPIYLRDLRNQVDKLNDIVASLRSHAGTLESFRMKAEAKRLKKVAVECEWEARGILPPDFSTDDPWIIVRDRGGVELRTYVIDLSITTRTIFGSPLYGTLAIVANVVFSRDDVTQNLVRDWVQ